ncbi:MAG: hypothetical protein ACKKMW_02090 [Candidatus Nealsonbacteria bacterium]
MKKLIKHPFIDITPQQLEAMSRKERNDYLTKIGWNVKSPNKKAEPIIKIKPKNYG